MLKKLFSLVIISITIAFSPLFAKDSIQLLTEKWIPYQIETKKGLKGISVDLVKQLQKKVGNKKEIKLFPWKRGYNLTLKEKGYALFLTTRSKKRENLFKWVGPISSMKITFFKNSHRKDLDIKTLQDAKKVSSIVVAEDTIEYQKLNELGFKNLEVNKLANYSLKKLLQNKVDLYPVESHAFKYEIKKKKLEDKIVPVKMKKPIFESNLYIAFNKQTPKSVINRWQKALDEIKEDGTYKKILSKYE